MKSVLRAGLMVAALTGIAGLLTVHTAAPADGQAPALADRVSQLEERMAALEARVAALDGQGGSAGQAAPAPAAAAQPGLLFDQTGSNRMEKSTVFTVPGNRVEVCAETSDASAERSPDIFVRLRAERDDEQITQMNVVGAKTQCEIAVVRPGEAYYINVGIINPTVWRVTVKPL